MVTGDKDFMQLVSDTAMIWDPMKEGTIGKDVILKANGVEPQQMIDIMGLSGDSG